MTLRFLLTVATAIAAATLTARAFDLVTYSFDGNLDPQTQQGITATGFLAQGGSEAVVGLSESDGQKYGYILIKDASETVNEAVSNQQFAQFTVSPPGLNGMQLAQVQVIAGRGGDSSPRGLALRWSFDNFQSNLGVVDIGRTWPGTGTYVFNLNAFAGVPVTFRLYAFAAETSKVEASIRFDQLTVTGVPVIYRPVTRAQSKFIETTSREVTVRGSAYSTVGIRRVEFSRGSRQGVYSGANGTSSWDFTATNLFYRTTSYWVRSISNDGQFSNIVRIRIKRSRPAPPTPTPIPSPTAPP